MVSRSKPAAHMYHLSFHLSATRSPCLRVFFLISPSLGWMAMCESAETQLGGGQLQSFSELYGNQDGSGRKSLCFRTPHARLPCPAICACLPHQRAESSGRPQRG